MKTRSIAALAAISLFTAAAAHAETVWRCGPGGSTYSTQPCADGRAVAVDDARSAVDVSGAAAVAARDRSLAATLVHERHEREREQRMAGSGLAGIKQVPRAAADTKPAGKPKKGKHPADDTGRAPATFQGVR